MLAKVALVLATAGSLLVAPAAFAGPSQPSGGTSTTQSWDSLRYYLTPHATRNSGRAMVVEREGARVFVTIITMQGSPACFSGTRISGGTYSGTLDNGYPPYRNWTITLTPVAGGVTETERHAGDSGTPYSERYRRVTKAQIKRVFDWNAWKLHQQYQAQCRAN